MAKDEKEESKNLDAENSDNNIEQTITSFEGILKVFPEDVGALESLFVAYQQAGRNEDALEKGFKLAEMLSQQEDYKRVAEIARTLLNIDPDNEKAQALLANAEVVIPESGKAVTDTQAGGAETEEAGQKLQIEPNISAEIDLGWFLLQNGFISQEQYETAVSGLTESRMRQGGSCISFLLEVDHMDGVDIEKILGFLAQRTDMPYIDLSRFELNAEVTGLIPPEKCCALGVLPFAQLRDEVMVGILNPFNETLITKLTESLNEKPHFYLCNPKTLDNITSKLEPA